AAGHVVGLAVAHRERIGAVPARGGVAAGAAVDRVRAGVTGDVVVAAVAAERVAVGTVVARERVVAAAAGSPLHVGEGVRLADAGLAVVGEAVIQRDADVGAAVRVVGGVDAGAAVD